MSPFRGTSGRTHAETITSAGNAGRIVNLPQYDIAVRAGLTFTARQPPPYRQFRFRARGSQRFADGPDKTWKHGRGHSESVSRYLGKSCRAARTTRRAAAWWFLRRGRQSTTTKNCFRSPGLDVYSIAAARPSCPRFGAPRRSTIRVSLRSGQHAERRRRGNSRCFRRRLVLCSECRKPTPRRCARSSMPAPARPRRFDQRQDGAPRRRRRRGASQAATRCGSDPGERDVLAPCGVHRRCSRSFYATPNLLYFSARSNMYGASSRRHPGDRKGHRR